jgi:8-oxo-dGTP diphosphatase
VLEETGHHVRAGRGLGEVHYIKQNDVPRPKVVRYWAMQVTEGAFEPGEEVDDLRWLEPDHAAAELSRESDLEVLRRFLSGPHSTGTVLLVRHASAGNRSGWPRDDRLRPLDETGFQQAARLVPTLTSFGVQKLISADYIRCVQTLEPMGSSSGITIMEEPLLSEQGFPGHEPDAEEAVRRLGLAKASTAICSQRLVVPNLLERLASADQVELPHLRAKKGSVWALSFDGSRLCGAEYFPPPSA